MYLKEFREKIGLTQKELGDILMITQTTITRYENDKVKPSTTIIDKYCELLNANPLFLFCGILPILLDEQILINKISKIKKKEIELEELKKNL